MKKLVVFLLIFSHILNVNAHSANIKGYKDEKSEYVSSCNNKFYGYHKKNNINHWHEIKFDGDEWNVLNGKETFSDNPCFDYKKQEVKFIRCVDGDTALFEKNGEEIKFRFLAVDTPESVHPTKEVEDYAKEASRYTCNMLTNATKIEVEYDLNSDITDKYGRNLAWIWINNILLQKVMIQEGYAKVAYIYGDYKYLNELCNVQENAINQKIGIWQYHDEIGYCASISFDKVNENKVNTYNVTFKDNGIIEEIKVLENMKVSDKKSNEKEGYKFVGWYLNGQAYDFNKKVTQDIVLEAKYIKISYIYYIIAIILVFVGCLLKNKKVSKRWKKLLRKL